MNDLQPLLRLLAQAQAERDAALAQHQQAQAMHRAAQTQAHQLSDYRSDYEQRWSSRFTVEGSAELLLCYQGFANRLTQAVDHQGRMIDQTASALEHSRMELARQELRVASVSKLIERRVAELQRAGERREQKQLDEWSSRAAWNRRANGTSTRY
jgi:flagellar FliJ protein